MMKKHLMNRKRRIVIIVLSLICALGAGLYTWQSISAWKGYEARLRTEQRTFERLKDAALTSDNGTKRTQAIRALDDKVAKRHELCGIHPLFVWQAWVIPPLKDGVKRCNDKVKQLDRLAGPLHTLRAYLDFGDRLQEVVGGLASDEAFTEGNWKSKGMQAAENAKKSLQALKTDGAANQLKTQAVQLTDKLIQSWQALIAANDAKDKAGFLTAADSVMSAYADFTRLVDTSDDAIKKQVVELTELAAAL